MKTAELRARLTLNKAQFDRGLRAASSQARAFGNTVKAAAGSAGKVAFAGLAAGAAGMAVAMKKAVSAAAEMEQLETSFGVLLKGAGAAKKRMEELAKFADTTPFELNETARASRTLEVLTKGALSTGEGLTLVGDIAAGTETKFDELAVTVGRLYDALSSGRPAGEALMRLQEIGAIGGDARSRIEKMQKAGNSFADIWKVATTEFSRFSGMMDKQSATWNGRISTLKDAADGVFREMGRPIIDVLNPQLKLAAEYLESLKPLAEDFGKALSGGIVYILPIIRNAFANINVQLKAIIANFQNEIHNAGQMWKAMIAFVTGKKFTKEDPPNSPAELQKLNAQAVALDKEFTRLVKTFTKSVSDGLRNINVQPTIKSPSTPQSRPQESRGAGHAGIPSTTGGIDYLKDGKRASFADALIPSAREGIRWNPKTGGFDRIEARPGLRDAVAPTSRRLVGMGPLQSGFGYAGAAGKVENDPFLLNGGIGFGSRGATPRKMGGEFGMFGFRQRKAAEREQLQKERSNDIAGKLDKLNSIDSKLAKLIGD